MKLIGNPYLCYDPASQVWTVGGSFNIGDAALSTGPPPLYGIGFHTDGRFDHGGVQSVTLPDPGLPLAPPLPVYLKSFGGSLAVDPTRIAATATVSAGVQNLVTFTITGGAFAVFASPAYPYTYQSGAIPGVGALQTDTSIQPITGFAAGIGGTDTVNLPKITLPVIGEVSLGSVPFGNAYGFYAAPSYFEFAGHLKAGLIGVQFDADLGGAIDLGNGQFNAGGGFKVCATFLVAGTVCPFGLQGVVSSNGIGACGSFDEITGGFSYRWGDSLPDIKGPFSCDLGPVTVVVQRSAALDSNGARAAQANAPIAFNLPTGVPSTSVYVTGAGSPPRVMITGPHGEQLSSPPGGDGVHSGPLVIWPEPALSETLIAVNHPAAGRWTVTPLTGSPAITRVAYANGLRPAKLQATVTGSGRRRTLAYRIRPRAGQQVTFAERGGQVFHVIGRAHGNSGRLRFAVALGPGGRREIVAAITLSGAPAGNLVIGHYTAPPPPVPGRPRAVRVERHARSVRVTWGTDAVAQQYLVVISLSDGRRVAYQATARRRVVTIPIVAPATTGRISVIGVGPHGDDGPAAVAELTAAPRPGRVGGIKARRTGKGVVISWHRAARAALYVVRVTLNGARATAFAPVIVDKPSLLSTRTLVRLKRRAVARLWVVAVASTGEEGPASSFTYRLSVP
jgi:hypothetical protein